MADIDEATGLPAQVRQTLDTCTSDERTTLTLDFGQDTAVRCLCEAVGIDTTQVAVLDTPSIEVCGDDAAVVLKVGISIAPGVLMRALGGVR